MHLVQAFIPVTGALGDAGDVGVNSMSDWHHELWS
jgi:hypothetical protein